MAAPSTHTDLAGPAGRIEAAIDAPVNGEARGVAVLCHPHPVHGGTMDNKVVQTLARAFVQIGYRVVRFNFRGVGRSQGQWDHGAGEIDDALAVVHACRDAALPLALGGFSFGGYIAAQVAHRLSTAGAPAQRVVLVGPATSTFPVPTVPSDALVIHGEADDVVPLSATLDWARPQGLPVVVLPGVGHYFHGQLTRLRDLVSRWGY
ncbi:MAG TPA: alpha/beta fold hydrolase [Burkholderiaceae bacterium]|nr:alpha/beta fold hydrolase [Burkholderiaceae bacterium]